MDHEELIALLKKPSLLSSGSLENPTIFHLEVMEDMESLKSLLADGKIVINDNFDSWLKEIFMTTYPKLKNTPNVLTSPEFIEFSQKNSIDLNNKTSSGVWIFFPWKKEIVHLLTEDLHFCVLTSRNKNLINSEQQNEFYKLKIGVAGLSVGQSIALTIATSGGGKHMHLADFDYLEGTNLNRIRGSVCDIGELKTNIVAKQIYEINPFADLKLFTDGLTDDSLNDFTDDVDIIIDEIDNFHFKALLRVKAKEKKIPLIMAFDTADGIVLDIERYDINPKQIPFFGNLTTEEFNHLVISLPDPREIPKLVTKSMGNETIPDLFKASILKVGSELAGVPQLGTTAFLAGSAVSFATRMLANGAKLNGRFYIDLRKLTNIDYALKLSDLEKELFKNLTT